MFTVTASTSATDLTVDFTRDYTRKLDAQRGARRYAARHPESFICVVDTATHRVVEQIHPITEPQFDVARALEAVAEAVEPLPIRESGGEILPNRTAHPEPTMYSMTAVTPENVVTATLSTRDRDAAFAAADAAAAEHPECYVAVVNEYDAVVTHRPEPTPEPAPSVERSRYLYAQTLDIDGSVVEQTEPAPQPERKRFRIGDPERLAHIKRTDIKAARPFSFTGDTPFDDGDFVLDVTTTPREGDPLVLMVTFSNPNDTGHPLFGDTREIGEAAGSRTPGGLRRDLGGYWIPVVYDERCPDEIIRKGKRWSNKRDALRELITLAVR